MFKYALQSVCLGVLELSAIAAYVAFVMIVGRSLA